MKRTFALVILLMISTSAFAGKIEIMTYNVLNLFDTVHDDGKDDWTFMPKGTEGKSEACAAISNPRYRSICYKTDWTPELLDIKLSQIRDVLLKYRKKLPNILVVTEIENENVLSMLADKLGYKSFIITNSPDVRGIDVAVLYNGNSKLKKIDSKEHVLTGGYFKKRPTRNILEVEFLVAGKYSFVLYGVHWPSQGNPSSARMAAAEKIKELAKDRLKLDPEVNIMVAGDFNTTKTDRPHPFHDVFLPNKFLADVHKEFMSDSSIPYEKRKSMPLGTYFFARDMSWNLLDRFFINRNLRNGSGLDVKLSTYEIYAPQFITHDFEYTDQASPLYGSLIVGTPKRYEFSSTSKNGAGYSDHFPVRVSLEY